MKRIVLYLCFMSLGCLVHAQIPSDSLVGYWPFNGNANDASGNCNNGIVNGATLTTDRFGIPNSAYSFNGTSNYISFSKIPLTQTSNWSITAWINPAILPQAGVAVQVGKDNGIGVESNGYGIAVSSKADVSVVGSEFGCIYGGLTLVNSNFVFTDAAKWYFTTIVRDTSTLKFYINGSLVDTIVISAPKTPTEFRIGSQNGIRFFNGSIDDVRIYNRVLKSSEIKSGFNESKCFETIHDTIHITIKDTTHLTINDTIKKTVLDTVKITVTDTLLINTAIVSLHPVVFNNTIKAYPNPTKDVLWIDCGDYTKVNNYKLKITNTISQEIWSTNITQNKFSINLSSFGGAGIYYLEVYDTQMNKIDVRKIVLQ